MIPEEGVALFANEPFGENQRAIGEWSNEGYRRTTPLMGEEDVHLDMKQRVADIHYRVEYVADTVL
jgi:hypothetical protein